MSTSTDKRDRVPHRTITHDEFDPIGTLVLIALYFAALVAMWLFTYFVEFLGNAPTPAVMV